MVQYVTWTRNISLYANTNQYVLNLNKYNALLYIITSYLNNVCIEHHFYSIFRLNQLQSYIQNVYEDLRA